jgi:hypothetical protein
MAAIAWLARTKTVVTDGLLADHHSWGVVGVRSSAEAVDSVANMIERGDAPAQIRLDR